MSKVTIFLAPGFEEIEALTVVDLCRRVGIEIIMAAVREGGDKNMVNGAEEIFVTGSHGIAVKADIVAENVDFKSQEMLVLPGGMPGTKNLEACGVLMQQLDAFYAVGKNIAAICAAPSIFGHRGFLKGRNACAYPGFESELLGADVTENEVEVSDHVITSRGLGTAIPFALAIVESFCGKQRAEELKHSIVYK